VPGAALASTPGPLTCGARRAREIDGLVVRVKVTIDLRSRHSTKRMHAVQGLWNPSTSSLTRGPLGAWGSLASHSRPSCRARRAREIDGLVAGQSYDRFTIAARPNDACRAGLWNPSTSSLTRGPLGAWGSLASHSRPSDMQGTQG
jgi:hypothetical protein